MTLLRSLPGDASLLHVFARFPASAEPLLDYHESVMRGPSPLGFAERELIAAYVSALNGCAYCRSVHEVAAGEFGIREGTLDALLADVGKAPIDDRLKPLFGYVRRLTLEPDHVTAEDASAVFEAGWDDPALYDAVSVCALFNFMNRLVEGVGIEADEVYKRAAGRRLHVAGYAALKSLLPSPSKR
jgi:uncharacterized peroxidase-related enzyme